MTGAFQGFLLNIMSFLGIPPGTRVRKADSNKDTDWAAKALSSHDFINTIVDITADDVCIGGCPVYIDGLEELKSPLYSAKLSLLSDAINDIIKWASVDTLKQGVSVYKLVIKKDGTPRLIPLNDSFEFYMNSEGDVVVELNGEVKKDLLVFLNYSKESLISLTESSTDSKLKGKGYLYKIEPEPVQLKHVRSVATDLYMVERAMYRYRVQLSRIVRFAEVEVGLSQGDNEDSCADNASAAVNANSMSLGMTSTTEAMDFDDNLPVVPTRKGVGSIEVKSDIPDFSMLKDMPDLEYTINRLFLALRFPKTYSDFNEALNQTAVSLIRGDIRYTRLTDSDRDLLQNTLNTWVFGDKRGDQKLDLSFKLTTIPSTEDDDVIESLQKYSEFTKESFAFIDEATSESDATIRLKSILILLGDSANLKSIQSWYTQMLEYVSEKFSESEKSDESGSESDEFSSDSGDLEDIDTGGSEESSISEEDESQSEAPESEVPESEAPESLGLPEFNV